jgi:heme-degrading monooxygenase HmoA
MQARVVSLRVPPGKAEELEAAYRNVLLPETEQYPGLSAMVILRNADTGEMLELTLWQDEEAKLASEGEEELLKWKLQSLAAVSGQTPTVRNYDLWLLS